MPALWPLQWYQIPGIPEQYGIPEPDFHDPVCGDHHRTGTVRWKSPYTGSQRQDFREIQVMSWIDLQIESVKKME